MTELWYDSRNNELILREPGFIGSVDGYRYIKCISVELDQAGFLCDKAIIARLKYIGEL